MKRLLETIKIEEGEIKNLFYHQQRFNTSRLQCFGIKESLDLESLIHPPQKGVYRCRIVYHQEILKIEYIPYIAKKVNTLAIVSSDIEYPYKYEDRKLLSSLLPKDVDEIIIVKDNLIRDTSISNLAFWDSKENKWLTPKNPLLRGTMRQKLLDEDFLHSQDIALSQINKKTKVAMINALLGFKILHNIQIKGL